jgi:hypothetical protein
MGEVTTGRDGAELALDEARQRAVVGVAAGDEVVEVVAQEADERAGLRVPWHIGTRRAGGRWPRDAARHLQDAHALHVGTRYAMAMRGSCRGLQPDGVAHGCIMSHARHP